MSNNLKGGFRPICGHSKARRYEVASGYATALFRGDVVTLVAAGTVEAASAGGADLILGVIAYVEYWSGGKRIEASYVPASTTYTPTARGSSQATYAYVWDDPGIEWEASVDSQADTDTAAEVYAAVGENMDITAGAGSTVYGQSGHTLNGNAEVAVRRFRVLPPARNPAQDLTAANWKARCFINEGFHPFHSTAGI